MDVRNGFLLLVVILGNLCLIVACEDRVCRWVLAGLGLYLLASVYAVLTQRRGD